MRLRSYLNNYRFLPSDASGAVLRQPAFFNQLLSSAFVACALFLAGCAASPNGGQSDASSGSQVSTESFNSARIHTELAASYYTRRQFDVSLDELRIALKSFPGYGPAHNMLGLVYMELNEDAKARQSFEESLRLSPNDSDANNNYGWFLCQRSDPAKSLPYFGVALRNSLYPTPERTLVNAGICSRKMKDMVGAEKYFLQALAAQPAYSPALFNLAELSFEGGNFEQSRTYLSRYMRVENPSAEALGLAVQVERQLGDRPSAASYAAQLCRRFAQSKECQATKAGVQR